MNATLSMVEYRLFEKDRVDDQKCGRAARMAKDTLRADARICLIFPVDDVLACDIVLLKSHPTVIFIDHPLLLA